MIITELIEPSPVDTERLRARLEIDPQHSYDGIDARDETIRMLEMQNFDHKTAIAALVAGQEKGMDASALPGRPKAGANV